MRDSMFDDHSVRVTLLPAVRSANGTVNGTAVDMAGANNFFRSAMLAVVSGTITDGTHTIALQHSDDGSTGWTNVSAAEREGTIPALTTANDDTVYRQGYVGTKRYLRATITTSAAPATPAGGIVGVVVVLSQGSGRPVS